jgi:hypothetical protein
MIPSGHESTNLNQGKIGSNVRPVISIHTSPDVQKMAYSLSPVEIGDL